MGLAYLFDISSAIMTHTLARHYLCRQTHAGRGVTLGSFYMKCPCSLDLVVPEECSYLGTMGHSYWTEPAVKY